MTNREGSWPRSPTDHAVGIEIGSTTRSQTDPISRTSSRPLPASSRDRLRDFLPSDDYGRQDVFVVYLSTPITTGPRLLDWLIANRDTSTSELSSDAEIVREEVIAENLAQLGPLRDRVRTHWPAAQLIDPTELTVPDWSQWEYHRFWVEVLNRFVDRIVFADGWELSTGCTVEYATGLRAAIPMEDARGKPITPADAARRFREAAEVLAAAGRDSSIALAAADRADAEATEALKDSHLAALADDHNVAAFVSVAPNEPLLRHRFVRGRSLSRSVGVHEAVHLLLQGSKTTSVNVRTFRPGSPKGNPFKYGLTRLDDVMQAVHAFAEKGFYCIVNETISVDDGGVSGVTLGGIAEFAPDGTPRVVEQDGTASLPIKLAQRILSTIYHSELTIPFDPTKRIEFSVHPNRVGHRAEHVVVWEIEDVDAVDLKVPITWPNRFSRILGDKTYGLLVADALGMPVPATTAVLRRVAPFRFGRSTGTGDWWMRTAPATQTPGHFTTTSGWSDPFVILMKEDADGNVSGVLAQEGVAADFSGATLPVENETGHLIEGVDGTGADFMLGDSGTVELPMEVHERVRALLAKLESALGSTVRIEWADDGKTAWVLQLHRVAQRSTPGVFSSGEATTWFAFDPSQGLDTLEDLIAVAREQGAGIEVVRPIGLTSHVGDLLRKARVPGRLSAGALNAQAARTE